MSVFQSQQTLLHIYSTVDAATVLENTQMYYFGETHSNCPDTEMRNYSKNMFLQSSWRCKDDISAQIQKTKMYVLL